MRGPRHVEDDAISLARTAVERDLHDLNRRVVKRRRIPEVLARKVVLPQLQRVIGRRVATEERGVIGLHPCLAALDRRSGRAGGDREAISQRAPGRRPGLRLESFERADRRLRVEWLDAVERVGAPGKAVQQPRPPVLERPALGHARLDRIGLESRTRTRILLRREAGASWVRPRRARCSWAPRVAVTAESLGRRPPHSPRPRVNGRVSSSVLEQLWCVALVWPVR